MEIVRLPVLPPRLVRLASPPGVLVESPHHPRAGADEEPIARFSGRVSCSRDGVDLLDGLAEVLVTETRLAVVVWDGASDGGPLQEGQSMAVLSIAFDQLSAARATAAGLTLHFSGDGTVAVVEVHHRLDEDLIVTGAADTPMLVDAIRRRRGSSAAAGARPRPAVPAAHPPPRQPRALPSNVRPVHQAFPVLDGGRTRPSAVVIPPPVWAVIGLLGLAGTLIAIPVLQALPDVLFADGDLMNGFRMLLLMYLLLAGAVGAACFGLAFLLWRADRVGRVLTIALSACIVLAFLLGSDRTGTDVLVVLAAMGVIAALAISPPAREYFTGANAFERDQPSSVVAARTILIVDAAMLALAGAFLLSAGEVDGKFVAIGLGLLGISVGGFWINGQLRVADPRARAIVSALMAGYAVLLIMLGDADASILVPLGLAVAVPVLLWLGPDSREYFGDPPIDYSSTMGMFQQQGRSDPDQVL